MERTSLLKLDKNIIKETSLLAFPIIIQGLVYELQSLTDKAFLGYLKTEYVSAIGAAQLPLNATMDGLVALAVAITIIVAHLYGAYKQEEASNYVKSAILYSGLFGVGVCFLWEVFTYPILHFFKVDPLIIDHSVGYVKICALFFLVIGIDSSLNAMLQGLGKTKVIMYSGIIKVFFNIFLSWVLIFGKFGLKEYHVAGAAIGTLISNCFAFCFVLSYCFIKRKEFGFGTFGRKDFSITYYSKVIKMGAPAGIEYLLWNFSNLILVRFINEFSYISTSIYTVTFGIQCIVYAVFANYSKAALTLIGQSLGARNYKNANDVFYNCLIINILIILCANAVFFLFTEDILSVFLKESYVVAQGEKYLMLIGLTMLPQSLNVVCGHAIKGNGNTKWMLLSQIFGSMFVISMSFLLIRGFHMGMVAIYLVVILDETIRGITNYIYYKRKYLNATIFEDISKLDRFFLRLQVETGVQLIERKSVIIFDEIQLFPKARQAIKHLVKDGRYDYIETGSLISIKKNVKDILIPSEEHKIYVYPMDYEEFLWATGGNPNVIDLAYKSNMEMGNTANRNAMRDLRIYMAVGGMPQAVESYIQTNSFESVDKIKREILHLYYDDLKKIDGSGRITDMYKSIPSQLAGKKKHYVISAATGKQKTRKDEERLFELIDSGLVLLCYNVTNPSVSLSQTKDFDCFKLYLSDIGLFTTMLFNDSENGISDIYRKLLSDKLPADLGYLYENVVAQMIKASGRDLYYHTWRKKESTHSYEIDFLLTAKNKVVPIEEKSSAVKNRESIDQFGEKYSDKIGDRFLLSQKDVGKIGTLMLKPIYMTPFLLKNM